MLKVFEMTNLGLMSYFLGMKVKQSYNGIKVSHLQKHMHSYESEGEIQQG
jgi:hypothetical protein